MLSGVMLSTFLVLAPQSSWGITHSPPREVGRLYWELIPQTEIWVRLIPEDPDGKPPLLNLVFHAYYPGKVERDVYTGLPQWPKGPPARLAVSAEPLPMTVIKDLRLQLVVDGTVFDLTGPNGRFWTCSSGDCAPMMVEADLDASVVRSVVAARSVGGTALGFPIKLVPADQRAVGDFLARIGMAEAPVAKK